MSAVGLGDVPRWRGFNLCEMFVTREDPRWPEMTPSARGRFVEDHFRWIADWGFDFVRLPLSYRWWSSPAAPLEIDEAAFAPIDDAVTWAQRYRLHLSINLHHAPGYCINEGLCDEFMAPEPFVLWRDPAALDCLIRHWTFIARRYRGVARETLSFDLINEPARCTREEYGRVHRAVVKAVRAISPERLLIIDGFRWGSDPSPELVDLEVVQSCRGYQPSELTHHLAWWAGNHTTPPTWPLTRDGRVLLDREGLARLYDPWVALQQRGVVVHCGECGCHACTPHPVFLAWLDDLLGLLAERRIGWALWNFCGSFGVLDSGRTDVAYEDWRGHRLDRKLLRLLQRR